MHIARSEGDGMTANDKDAKPPVVEARPASAARTAPDAVELRVSQQKLLADFGVLALEGTPLAELLTAAARIAADGLEAEFSKVLEFMPTEGRFLVRAGVGWDAGTVGQTTVGADLASPAGYALRTGKPVISNHLGADDRFRTPELLLEHGVRRAMNVILSGDGRPFGVLEVDSCSPGEFDERDIAFLQGVANLLGMTIARQRAERGLKDALQRHKVLLEEVNHRVKNSLQLVSAMLDLQAHAGADEALREQLEKASGRIAAIARAHDLVHQHKSIQSVDLGLYLTDICKEPGSSTAHCEIKLEAPVGFEIAIEKAIPIALIVNELITNAAKYAYPRRRGGPVWVTVASRPTGAVSVIVRDEGVGLPAGFDVVKGKGLGTRIVAAFTKQLGAELSVRAQTRGCEFEFVIPSPMS
jgi:two-component sensor histidine kinase